MRYGHIHAATVGATAVTQRDFEGRFPMGIRHELKEKVAFEAKEAASLVVETITSSKDAET